jgi:hypothetical protein
LHYFVTKENIRMAELKAKPVTVYFTDAQKERVEIIKDKRGTDNVTRTISWLVDDEWRRVEGHNTKEDALQQLQAGQEQLRRKVDLTLLLVWRLLACEKVELTAEDVRKLRELVAELQL